MAAPSAQGPLGPLGPQEPSGPDGDLLEYREPVITRPDPMTEEEAEAWLDAVAAQGEPFDPEEWFDPEGPPPPGEDQLTAEELAGIRQVMDDQPEAAAEAARLKSTGAIGAIAASLGRRGPGQPGSAHRFPGESSSRAAAFGSGLALDVMPGCPDLAAFADRAAGADDSYNGVSDDELIGVLCAWGRLEAHMAARKLAAVAELIRRRPAPDSEPEEKTQAPESERPDGQAPSGRAPEAQAPDGQRADGQRPDGQGPDGRASDERTPDGNGPDEQAPTGRMPDGWDEFTGDELAQVMAESRGAAEGLLELARDLTVKLPGTMAALRDGILRESEAWIIACATRALDAAEARAAEARVLDRAGRLTPGGLRSAIARAVMEVAPKKARKRREQAAREARVQRWAEDSGNAALMGRELPPAEVLAADQRITAWARELKKAGLEGSMDELRARAYLDLLLGQDSRPSQAAADGKQDPEGPPAPAPGGPPAGVIPAGFAGRITLTIPLATLTGLADRPGEISGIGPVDPWLARDLANAAAQNPRSMWCVTVTDEQGHAVGHGCARPEPKSQEPMKPKKRERPGSADGHDPPGEAGNGDRAGDGGTGFGGTGFVFTTTNGDGPPGGYGTWRLSTGITGRRDLLVALDSVTTENCDHRYQAKGHDPGVKLRHLSQIRHTTCTAPTCRRPANQCDFEHNTAYEAGGLTCLCNGGPKCRRDHRLKQHPKWRVEQLADGTFRWTTPSGRQYTTEPTRYPV